MSHEAEDITDAIRINGYDDFAGWNTLQHNEDGQPDIGISLLQEHRGHGYGPEAVKLYCNWLNQEYGLSRFYVRISDDNEYSKKAFAKLGAKRYDTKENQWFKMLIDKQKQLEEDIANDQISMKEYLDPFTGEPTKDCKIKSHPMRVAAVTAVLLAVFQSAISAAGTKPL